MLSFGFIRFFMFFSMVFPQFSWWFIRIFEIQILIIIRQLRTQDNAPTLVTHGHAKEPRLMCDLIGQNKCKHWRTIKWLAVIFFYQSNRARRALHLPPLSQLSGAGHTSVHNSSFHYNVHQVLGNFTELLADLLHFEMLGSLVSARQLTHQGFDIWMPHFFKLTAAIFWLLQF